MPLYQVSNGPLPTREPKSKGKVKQSSSKTRRLRGRGKGRLGMLKFRPGSGQPTTQITKSDHPACRSSLGHNRPHLAYPASAIGEGWGGWGGQSSRGSEHPIGPFQTHPSGPKVDKDKDNGSNMMSQIQLHLIP